MDDIRLSHSRSYGGITDSECWVSVLEVAIAIHDNSYYLAGIEGESTTDYDRTTTCSWGRPRRATANQLPEQQPVLPADVGLQRLSF